MRLSLMRLCPDKPIVTQVVFQRWLDPECVAQELTDRALLDSAALGWGSATALDKMKGADGTVQAPGWLSPARREVVLCSVPLLRLPALGPADYGLKPLHTAPCV